MKQRRFGFFLVMAIALMSLTGYFLGCDWGGGGDDGGGGGNGPTTSKFVVVADTYAGFDNTSLSFAGNLSVYKIQSDGTLSFLDNVALNNVGSGNEPSMVLMSPNKLFVYVANHNALINILSFNSDTGALTETEGSPVEIGIEPINMAITPDGKFLYVTDQGDSLVHIFGVDNTTGDLTFSESVDVFDIHSVAMHPTGKFVYLGTEADEIWAYAIDAETGSLTAVEGTPYFSDAGGTWVWLQTTPDGNYLFGAGQDVGAVLAIDNVSGGLTEVTLDDTTGWFPKSLVVAPTLPFMFSANWDDDSIGAFKANSDGTVDNVVGMPFAAGVTPKSVTITEDSKYLYVANYGFDTAVGKTRKNAGEGTVQAFRVNRSSGVLSLVGTYHLGLGAGPKFLTTLP